MSQKKKLYDEPVQSDATLIMKVEDLIHMAMGPPDLNIVNFKLVETVLYILARQMRMLEQKVEIRVGQEMAKQQEEGEAEESKRRKADTGRRDKDSEKVTRGRGDRDKTKTSKDRGGEKDRVGDKKAELESDSKGGRDEEYERVDESGKKIDRRGRDIKEDDQERSKKKESKERSKADSERTGTDRERIKGDGSIDSKGYDVKKTTKKAKEGEMDEEIEIYRKGGKKISEKAKKGKSDDADSDEYDEESRGYSKDGKKTSEKGRKDRSDAAESDEYDDEGKTTSRKVKDGGKAEESRGYSKDGKKTSEKGRKDRSDAAESDEYDDEGKMTSRKVKEGGKAEESRGYSKGGKKTSEKGRKARSDAAESDEYDDEGKITSRKVKEGGKAEESRGYSKDGKKTSEKGRKDRSDAAESDEGYGYEEGKRKRKTDTGSPEYKERSEKGTGGSKARRLAEKATLVEDEESESPDRERTSSSPDVDDKGQSTEKKSGSPDRGRKGQKGGKKMLKASKSDVGRGGKVSKKGKDEDYEEDAQRGKKRGKDLEDRSVGDDKELDADSRGKGKAARDRAEKGIPDEDEDLEETESVKVVKKKGKAKRDAADKDEAATDKKKGKKDRGKAQKREIDEVSSEDEEDIEEKEERDAAGKVIKAGKGKAEKGKAGKAARKGEKSEREEGDDEDRYREEERDERGERGERGVKGRDKDGKKVVDKEKKKGGRGKEQKDEESESSDEEEAGVTEKGAPGKRKAVKEKAGAGVEPGAEKGKPGKGKKGAEDRRIDDERGGERKDTKGRKRVEGKRKAEEETESSSEDDEEYEEWEDGKGAPGTGVAGKGAKGGKGKGKEKDKDKYGTSVKDVSRDGEKVLAVGKSRKKGDDGKMRVGSVEVVSQKEFDALQEKVRALQGRASLPPTPTMPDNAQLRSDIARGSATLTDTMQAMQLWARVEAAEKAVDAMAELLAQLIASGALPPEVAGMADTIKAEVDTIRQDMSVAKHGEGAGKKEGADDIKRKLFGTEGVTMYDTKLKQSGTTIMADGASSGLSSTLMPHSMVSGLTTPPLSTKGITPYEGKQCVTHSEMVAALQHLREEIIKKIGDETAYAAATAENASSSVKGIIEKMDIALKLDERMTFLQSLVHDYSEQLAGFDAGLNTQIAGFQDQMAQIRVDLTAGLAQLENVNSNAETAAILELTERYEELVVELDQTLMQHQEISAFQKGLTEELRSLIEAVEMMREEKADRDEVLDGLRDKADSSRLEGLLTEEKFNKAREELENRMQLCYEKFHRQDAVWMNVVDDFTRLVEGKAELVQLLSLHDHTQDALRDLNDKVHQLACLLGEPKAAILTRKLAKDGTCGVCRVPALMEPVMPKQPTRLPAVRSQPDGAPADTESETCLRGFKLPERQPPENQHLCQRWVGGSHTMIGSAAGLGNVNRERAKAIMDELRPTRRYYATGNDGKLYKFEEEVECVPCAECNVPEPEQAGDTCTERIPGAADTQPGRGGGDEPVEIMNVVYASQAARVKVVDEEKLEQLEDKPTDQRDRAGSEQRRSLVDSKVSERAAQLIGEETQLPPGATELFPSSRKRTSDILHVESFGAENIINTPTQIGSSVKGQPVISQEQLERQQIMKQIEADQDTMQEQVQDTTQEQVQDTMQEQVQDTMQEQVQE